MPAPDSRISQRIIDAELDRFPEMRTAYNRHTAKREDGRHARRQAEWDCADVVIAASNFTKKSFGMAGLDAGKVRIVPLGAPEVASRDEALSHGSSSEPLLN